MEKVRPAYIGTKIVQAEPMTKEAFKARTIPGFGAPQDDKQEEGYLVVYPDGYESWSPKETFEGAYRLVSPAEARMI